MNKKSPSPEPMDASDAVSQFLQSAKGKRWITRFRNEGSEGFDACARELREELAQKWPEIGKGEMEKRCGIALGQIKGKANIIKQKATPAQVLPAVVDEMALQLDVINCYPRPLAYAYHRMVNKAKTTREWLDGLLDTAEALSHTLAAIVLGLYLKQPKTERDAKWDQEIFETVFVKGKLSFGHWVGLAIGAAKRLDGETPGCEAVLAFLLDSEVDQLCRKLVEVRNQYYHLNNRSVPVPEEVVRDSLLILKRLLAGAAFLKDVELVVPLQYEDDAISRADSYVGIHRLPNYSLAKPLVCDRNVTMPTKRAVLVHLKTQDNWLVLYPWLSWHEWVEGKQEGLYCLSQIECKIDPPQRLVKSAVYRTYESELSESKEVKELKTLRDDPETLAIQDFLRLLEIPFGVCVRSINPNIPLKLPEQSVLMLDLQEFFDNRYVRNPTMWNQEIRSKIVAFFAEDAVKKLPQPIRLFFDTHLSIAFFLGHLINPKWGALLLPTQKSKTSELGYDDWAEAKQYPANLWQATWPASIDSEVVVALSITNPVEQHVDAYLKAQNMDKLPRILLRTASNASQINSEQAWQLAHDLNQTLRMRLPASCRKMHLFYSIPVALAYILGHKLRCVTPEIQLYEHDFEGKNPLRYSPSITIE